MAIIVSIYYITMYSILAVALAALVFTLVVHFIASKAADKAQESFPNNRAMRRGRWSKAIHRGKAVGKHMRQVGGYSSFRR